MAGRVTGGIILFILFAVKSVDCLLGLGLVACMMWVYAGNEHKLLHYFCIAVSRPCLYTCLCEERMTTWLRAHARECKCCLSNVILADSKITKCLSHRYIKSLPDIAITCWGTKEYIAKAHGHETKPQYLMMYF